jgi:hypothetical protein
VLSDLLDQTSSEQQESTKRHSQNSGTAYLNIQTTRLFISVSRFRGETREG